MQLRDYQIELIDKARDALKEHRSVLLQGPTGMGKTALTVFMMAEAAKRGKNSIFLVHQKELLNQTSKALWHQSLHHGIIASGKRQSKLPASVASVQTLVKRLDKIQEPNLLIIDEAHRAAADSYTKIIQAWPNCKIIGLTATPRRTDGKPLDISFDHLVIGPSVRELIDKGYLSDFEIFAPPSDFDRKKLHVKMGDFDAKEAENLLDKPAIIGDAVDHYKKLCYNKSCVVMCVTVEHAVHVAESYNIARVNAEVIHGGMTDRERASALDRFSCGQISVLCTVQLLIEGVDIPRIEVIQWLRPTKSLVIWMQGNGRGLRPFSWKKCLTILDHVGNFSQHGMPDKNHEWNLRGQLKAKAGIEEDKDEVDNIKVKQCTKCYSVFNAGPDACPRCGELLPKFTRQLEVKEGTLEKIKETKDEDNVIKLSAERSRARSIAALIELGIRKGMKNPSEWAAFVTAAREGRKATQADFSQARRELIRIEEDAKRNSDSEKDSNNTF